MLCISCFQGNQVRWSLILAKNTRRRHHAARKPAAPSTWPLLASFVIWEGGFMPSQQLGVLGRRHLGSGLFCRCIQHARGTAFLASQLPKYPIHSFVRLSRGKGKVLPLCRANSAFHKVPTYFLNRWYNKQERTKTFPYWTSPKEVIISTERYC